MLSKFLRAGLVLALAGGAWTATHAQNAPAAQPAAEDPAEAARRAKVLAKVHGVEITVGRVEDHLKGQSPLLRARYANPEQLKDLVDNMIRFELLAAEAEKRGYNKHDSVVRAVKEGAVQNLTRIELDEKITPTSVPQEEVQAYYDSHPDEFHRPKMVRASHVLLDSAKEAGDLLKRARKVDERGFRELAKKHSKDPQTKLRGGDLRYFTLEPKDGSRDPDVHPALRKAAFELKNLGDTVTKPVKVDERFSVLRLTGLRPERHTPVEQAAGPIRTRLWRQKRKDALSNLITSLRESQKPQVKPELVDNIQLDEPDQKRAPGFAPDPTRNPHNPHGGGRMPVAPPTKAPAPAKAPASK